MTTETFISGKDAALESTIATMQKKLAARGFQLNESSLLHEVDGIWSTHMKDNECPMLFSNGKGATELAARASAYGEVLVDLNSGNAARGICALPYTRLSDNTETFILVNIISNLYVSNGRAARCIRRCWRRTTNYSRPIVEEESTCPCVYTAGGARSVSRALRMTQVS